MGLKRKTVVVFKPRNTDRAKSLRNAATPAERELWKYLSRRQVGGRKLSRQMPVGPYYADFLCREQGLIIEIDGYSHETQQSYDAKRTSDLVEHGYKVIRFTNDDVLNNVAGVVGRIEQVLAELPTQFNGSLIPRIKPRAIKLPSRRWEGDL